MAAHVRRGRLFFFSIALHVIILPLIAILDWRGVSYWYVTAKSSLTI